MIPEKNCGLNIETQNKLKSVFSQYSQIEKVVLYGSRAKGTYKAGSDIDLTIFSEKINISELLKIENEIDDLLLPYKIDLSLFHKLDNASLIDHIQRIGIIFYKT